MCAWWRLRKSVSDKITISNPLKLNTMKKMLIALLALFVAVPAVQAQKKKISVIPAEAKIYVDGQYVADGSYILQFNNKNEVYVLKLECPGYATKENLRVLRSDTRKTIVYTLNKDDALEGSVASEQANKYFTIRVRPGVTVEQAWKLLTQTMLNYYDELQTSDRSSGFMNTAWAYQTFPMAQLKVRTRVQIKERTNDDELAYQIRISSEIADIDAGKQGYKAWDRVVKKYEPLINEMQMRLQ